jgi:integrase/recombinase XerD
MEHYSELQNHYKQWLKTLGFSKSIVYGYPGMLYYFLAYLENKGIHHITLLRSSHVNDYFNYLQTRRSMRRNKRLSAAHLNKSFDAIDKFLEFLNQMDHPNIPAPTHYRILETKAQLIEKVKVLTKDEIQIIYQSVSKLFPHFTQKEAESRQAIAILVLDLCYGCGLRRSEACNLLVEDIDLDKKTLFVRQAKGYKDRYVPLSEMLNERIKVFIYQYRKHFKVSHKRLFPLVNGSMYYYIKNLRSVSGLNRDFGLHTLRHSIATHLLQNGMSIEQIARFLGHSTLDSTQVYTHLINNDEK